MVGLKQSLLTRKKVKSILRPSRRKITKGFIQKKKVTAGHISIAPEKPKCVFNPAVRKCQKHSGLTNSRDLCDKLEDP
jgi:hypothetical protein